jgi:hypothetical protein
MTFLKKELALLFTIQRRAVHFAKLQYNFDLQGQSQLVKKK